MLDKPNFAYQMDEIKEIDFRRYDVVIWFYSGCDQDRKLIALWIPYENWYEIITKNFVNFSEDIRSLKLDRED